MEPDKREESIFTSIFRERDVTFGINGKEHKFTLCESTVRQLAKIDDMRTDGTSQYDQIINQILFALEKHHPEVTREDIEGMGKSVFRTLTATMNSLNNVHYIKYKEFEEYVQKIIIDHPDHEEIIDLNRVNLQQMFKPPLVVDGKKYLEPEDTKEEKSLTALLQVDSGLMTSASQSEKLLDTTENKS